MNNCTTCGYPHLLGFEYGHEQTDEDFITRTIRDVDPYLAGERESECEQCRAVDAELDEEFDRYWSEHCQEHGCELLDGSCPICAQEDQHA